MKIKFTPATVASLRAYGFERGTSIADDLAIDGDENYVAVCDAALGEMEIFCVSTHSDAPAASYAVASEAEAGKFLQIWLDGHNAKR